ncbi:hypothetical protein [Methanobrevibacter sp.]|uniref:hypothetical protein n=1 Tax=Methanobrevibacter sp. TaxID=66852 RepID=UPI0039762600
MIDNILQFIQVYDKRIFIDVASNGCGNGCVYCFTKNPEKPQTLLNISTIDEICIYISNLPNSKECIISLCPNTEPMKSEKSRELILRIIKRLSKIVKFIQIATKELIPESYLQELNNLCAREGQIRISISVPYLDLAEKIEPHAARVSERLINFINIKNYSNLVSVIYLRPFNKQMIIDKFLYADIINKYQPDNICLGAEYVPKVDGYQQCTYMYNTFLKPSIFERPEMDEIFAFADFLRQRTNCKLFFSSVCNIANCSDYGCVLNLDKHDIRYCQDCTILLDER